MPRPRPAIWTALVLAACCAACTLNPRSIDVSVFNASVREIDDVSIRCPDCAFRHDFGDFRPLEAYNYGMAIAEVPRQLEVSWTEAGKPRTMTIRVPDSNAKTSRVVVVFGAESTPGAKLVIGSSFSSQLIPDSADPAFGRYRQLAAAAYHGRSAEVAELLASGAPQFWEDPEIQSPMEWASIDGNDGTLKTLLAAEPELPAPRVLHAIELAAQNGHVDCLRALRPHVSSFDAVTIRPALQRAAEHGQGAVVRYFLEEASIDVNAPITSGGHSLLDVALNSRHSGLASYIASRGGVSLAAKTSR